MPQRHLGKILISTVQLQSSDLIIKISVSLNIKKLCNKVTHNFERQEQASNEN